MFCLLYGYFPIKKKSYKMADNTGHGLKSTGKRKDVTYVSVVARNVWGSGGPAAPLNVNRSY
jgi:hypothetical protein